MCGAKSDVRFTPNSDRKSGHSATSTDATWCVLFDRVWVLRLVIAMPCRRPTRAAVSALGQKQTLLSAKRHVRFALNSDRESGFPQTVLFALPPKATRAAQTVMSAKGQ
jgi:hypothetical protein